MARKRPYYLKKEGPVPAAAGKDSYFTEQILHFEIQIFDQYNFTKLK